MGRMFQYCRRDHFQNLSIYVHSILFYFFQNIFISMHREAIFCSIHKDVKTTLLNLQFLFLTNDVFTIL